MQRKHSFKVRYSVSLCVHCEELIPQLHLVRLLLQRIEFGTVCLLALLPILTIAHLKLNLRLTYFPPSGPNNSASDLCFYYNFSAICSQAAIILLYICRMSFASCRQPNVL